MAHLAACTYRTWDPICCQTFRAKNFPLQKPESPLGSRQIAVERIQCWEYRRKSFTRRIAAAADGNGETEIKQKEKKASALTQLDQQLATLSERDDSSASRPSSGPSTREVRPTPRPRPSSDIQWPDFSGDFLGFAGISLLLLTLINNLLYRVFLGPPVVPYGPDGPLSSADEGPRHRITSLSEERELAKAAAQRAFESQAIVSREAPPPSDVE
ncbi:hypothetical protein R1sor_008125 [Riccia sorocarpa]|uniref:Uncharacterized protein n=1 Tax=Riccia sorocarpa TaxID=122646 RepID=A0ABD3HYR5_9MARC